MHTIFNLMFSFCAVVFILFVAFWLIASAVAVGKRIAQNARKTVKIKLVDGGIMPTYMTKGAVGADVYANKDFTVRPNETAFIPLGFCVEVPKGYEMQIRPRSGFSCSKEMFCPNSIGTIDEDYRGEVSAVFKNLGSETVEIKKGDRIAQAVIAPIMRAKFKEVAILSRTERDEGSFGSTGKA